jgi:pathogenesis-related protein 1
MERSVMTLTAGGRRALLVAIALGCGLAGCPTVAGGNGTALTEDGFESGDTLGWSREVGLLEGGRMTGMTAVHNAVRSSVVGEAIPTLRWSKELSDIAQSWADHLAGESCAFYHSNNGYGENLYWTSGGDPAPSAVVGLWASEGPCWTYGRIQVDDACSLSCGNSSCYHYTQLVWRNTALVGCGFAECSNGAEIWCCSYDPQGNIIGQYPY